MRKLVTWMRGLWETKGFFLADESDNYQFLLPVLIRDFSLKLQVYKWFTGCLIVVYTRLYKVLYFFTKLIL